MIEGKIANQSPMYKNTGKSLCSKCNKLMDYPDTKVLGSNKKVYLVRSYLDSPFYIYETRKGQAVVYCSKYCRDKHNHRFQK